MAILRALVTVPATTGIPKDSMTNTWHFMTSESVLSAGVVTIKSWLQGFYSDIDTYRGLLHDWDSTTIKVYNLDDPPERVPIDSSSLGLSATAAASTLPSECALVLTFQATPASGQPQGRRRGRIYLGGLAAVAADSSTGRPNVSFVTAVVAAAQTMLTASVSSAATRWIVASSTFGAVPGTHDPISFSAVDVEEGWVDNAWDTQRRRGLSPTNRVTFT